MDVRTKTFLMTSVASEESPLPTIRINRDFPDPMFPNTVFVGNRRPRLSPSLLGAEELVLVKLFSLPETENMRRAERETRALREIDHPGVIRLLDEGVDRDHWEYCLVMEGFENTLESWTMTRPEWPSFAVMKKLMWDMAQTLLHIHEEFKFLHLDIKPSSYFIKVLEPHKDADDDGTDEKHPQQHREEEQYRVVLGNFGCARKIDHLWSEEHLYEPFRVREQGSLGFMAPEVVLGCEARPQTDVWNLGLVFFYLFSGGEHLFHTASDGDYLGQIQAVLEMENMNGLVPRQTRTDLFDSRNATWVLKEQFRIPHGSKETLNQKLYRIARTRLETEKENGVTEEDMIYLVKLIKEMLRPDPYYRIDAKYVAGSLFFRPKLRHPNLIGYQNLARYLGQKDKEKKTDNDEEKKSVPPAVVDATVEAQQPEVEKPADPASQLNV